MDKICKRIPFRRQSLLDDYNEKAKNLMQEVRGSKANKGGKHRSGCSSRIQLVSQYVVGVKQTASGADMTTEAVRMFAKSWTCMHASVNKT